MFAWPDRRNHARHGRKTPAPQAGAQSERIAPHRPARRNNTSDPARLRQGPGDGGLLEDPGAPRAGAPNESRAKIRRVHAPIVG
jgi:hypothetical protein